MKTNFAAIDTESLKNPVIVNYFEQAKVIVEYEPESNARKYHHVFFLRLSDKKLEKAVKTIQKEIRNGWYAFFWNSITYKIVFKNKTFTDYKTAKKYGIKQGIQGKFLNLKTYLERYKAICS